MNENVDRPGDDVIRCGAKLAFLANDLTLFVAMQDRRAFRPIIKLRTRHFFERGQILDELIDAQRFTGKFFNVSRHIGWLRATGQKYLFAALYGRTFPGGPNDLFISVNVLKWLASGISASIRTCFETFCGGYAPSCSAWFAQPV